MNIHDAPNNFITAEAVERRRAMNGSVGEEEPSSLCASTVYRSSITSFVSRATITKIRTISRCWEETIADIPSNLLPRINFLNLEVLVVSPGIRSCHGRSIEGLECCREILSKAGVSNLAGQLVFPRRDEMDVAVLRVKLLDGNSVVFRAPNRLTKATAGQLIHFLHHIDESYCYRLEVQAHLPKRNDVHGRPMGALNPRIFTAYHIVVGKPLRVYAEEVNIARLLDSTSAVLTAGQLVAKSRAICFDDVIGWRMGRRRILSTAMNDTALAVVSTVPDYCSKIVVRRTEMDELNRIVQFYRDYNGEVGSLMPDVELRGISTIKWPAALSKEDAEVVTKKDWYRAHMTMEHCDCDYVYTFENDSSGRSIKITIDVKWLRSVTEVQGKVVHGAVQIKLRGATLRECRLRDHKGKTTPGD